MLPSAAADSPRFFDSTFPPDEEIVQKVLGGEVALFEVLMRRHNQRVYRTVRAILKDECEVEDAMQQSYVSAYCNLRQFAGSAKFSTWLTRIAINEALARARRAERFASSESLPESTNGQSMDENPEENTSRHELASILERAIDALPELYRSAVVFREIEGLSTAEAAEVLGVTEEVVKTRLHRARQLMRDSVYERMNTHAKGAFPFYAPRCDRVVAAVLAMIRQLGSAR
jgi:RNA polymerase sigma-70 factor (ECF subfamily)